MSSRVRKSRLDWHVRRTTAPRIAFYVGPFRNRSTAVQFESAFLDLFQLRRCQEDLVTSPTHPGCIYGEMGRCLRPCQQAVGVEEYRSEALRVAEFLRTGGRSLIASASGERERLSAEMDFEGAARAHQRVQKVEEVLGWRDEMARDVEQLHAVAIVPSAQPESIELGWLRGGYWQGFRSLDFITADDGRAISLDSRLREMAATIREGSSVSGPATHGTPRDSFALVLFQLVRRRTADGGRLGKNPLAQTGQRGVAGSNHATEVPSEHEFLTIVLAASDGPPMQCCAIPKPEISFPSSVLPLDPPAR